MSPQWIVTLAAYISVATINRTFDGNTNSVSSVLTAQEPRETKMLDD